MISNLLSLLTLAVIAVASYGLGAVATTALRLKLNDAALDDAWSRWMWRSAVGLVPAGTTLAVAGVAMQLHHVAVWTLTLLGLAAAAYSVWREREAHALPGESPRIQSDPRGSLGEAQATAKDGKSSADSNGHRDAPRWLAVSVLWLSATALVATGVTALAPPTAGDALCYHLELPKAFLRAGGMPYLPDAHESTFPLLTEMWFLWAMALGGAVAAQLVHFGLGVLLLLAVREAAQPLGPRWAWTAAAVAALAPIVTNEMTAPLNDVALAAFAALAWAAGERADRSTDRRSSWWIVAGLMLGAACAIKFTGLVFAVAWGAARLTKAWCSSGKEKRAATRAVPVRLTPARIARHPVVIVALAAFLTAGVWYGRAAWHTGNPVHPYFSAAFGRPAETSMRESKRPLGRNPIAWLSAPFETTFSPERYGGRAHQFGPLFLATLPALLFLARDRRAWPAMMLAAVYALFWLLLRQNLRFALPLLPFLAIGVAATWRALPTSGNGRLVVLAAGLAMLAMMDVIALRRTRHSWAVALGVETREAYLARCEPTAAAAAAVNRLTSSDARVLSQETRAYYFDRDLTRESLFRKRTAAYNAETPPGVLAERLTREGFTHLLLAERTTSDTAPYDDVISRVVNRGDAAPATEPFRVIAETSGRDLDGAEYRYRLVEIPTRGSRVQ